MRPAWMTSSFLREAAKALSDIGFITNEHIFTPYGKGICENVESLQDSLASDGSSIGKLSAGSLLSVFGTIYYVFDNHKIPPSRISKAVLGGFGTNTTLTVKERRGLPQRSTQTNTITESRFYAASPLLRTMFIEYRMLAEPPPRSRTMFQKPV